MFASRVTKDVTISGEDGSDDVIVTIQKLSARSLDNAQTQRHIALGQTARGLGADVLQTIRDIPDKVETEKTPEELRTARYGSYDRDSVLISGIVRWTAEITLDKGVGDLDEETATTLFHEILDLSLPPVDPKEAEERQGKS